MMKWYGDRYEKILTGQLRVNVLKAAGIIADVAVEMASTPYPPASVPGEPPHRRTGNLVRHIREEQGPEDDIDEEVAAYAVSDGASDAGFPYAAHLELNMQRAYLVPAMDKSHDAIIEAMADDG